MAGRKNKLDRAVAVLRLLESIDKSEASGETEPPAVITGDRSGQTAGPSAAVARNRLESCKRKQVQLHQHGLRKKSKLGESSGVNQKSDGVWLKVCLMRLKRFRYEKNSPLKSCYMKLSNTWSEVKAAIASAFGMEASAALLETYSIIVADAELHEDLSMPTLQSYISNRKGNIGRTIFGLYIPLDSGVEDPRLSRSVTLRRSSEEKRQQSTNVASIGQQLNATLYDYLSNSSPEYHTDSSNRSHDSYSYSSPEHSSKGKKKAVAALACEEVITLSSGSSEHNSDPPLRIPSPNFSLMTYSAQELKVATNNYAAENLLGQGGFGEVYSARLHFSDVAIKVLKKGVVSEMHEFFMQEMQFLSRYQHKHVVQILGVCMEKGHLAFVMEKMANGCLMQHLHVKKDMPRLGTRLRILHEAAQGIAFLHYNGPDAKPLLHLDIKSSNILLNEDMRAKICDFGLAKELPIIPAGKSYAAVNSMRFSRGYEADEYYDGQLSPKLDVFSFGVVVVESYTGRPAYSPTAESKRLVVTIRDALYDLNAFIEFRDPKITAINLPDMEVQQLAKCTLASRCDRITMEQVLTKLAHIRSTWKLW